MEEIIIEGGFDPRGLIRIKFKGQKFDITPTVLDSLLHNKQIQVSEKDLQGAFSQCHTLKNVEAERGDVKKLREFLAQEYKFTY
ncbi:hypothetical protein HOE07_01935 [archaeon]|jgi:hypothetical protein|nr:hypothetical protein [archaeon]